MAARVRGLLVLGGVAATLLAGVVTGPAAEAQTATCTAPTATLTVSPNTVASGAVLTVTGANFDPSTAIYFFDNGQAIGTVMADASGNYSVTGPATGSAGQHALVGSQASGRCASTTYTITGANGATTTTCPSGYVQSGNQCVLSNSGYTGSACPAGYVQSGNQCVPTNSGYAPGYTSGGVCPTGYYYDGTQCVAGAYPGTNPGPYSGVYPGANTGQGGCPAGYVNIGNACQPGPYAGAYCPTGAPPGSGCAVAQGATPYASTPYASTPYSTTATTVVQSAPQAVASGRVAYTGSSSRRSVALGLALLIGGLLLLSARAVVAPFRR